jgi:RimJ/RimL family protein N-acetyltransferase
MTPPLLSDGVITLRVHRPSDIPRLLEQCRDPETVRWTTVPSPYAEHEAADYIGRVAERWLRDQEFGFAIEHEGRYCGGIALRPRGPAVAELGYTLHPDARGLGLTDRAMRLVLRWAFDELGVRTALWQAFVGNWASRRIAWRLGFRLEGTLRDVTDQRGELRSDWVATLRSTDPMEPATPWLDRPRLTGDGVVLRPHDADDDARLAEAAGDPASQWWLAFLPRDFSLADAAARREAETGRRADGVGVTWALCTPDDDRYLGDVGLYRIETGESAEVGYWLHPDARGRGLAVAGARLAVRHAFDALGVRRVRAEVAAGNAASHRVIEALGLRRSGVRRAGVELGDGTYDDLVDYELMRDEAPA